jgi:hypothetical protein
MRDQKLRMSSLIDQLCGPAAMGEPFQKSAGKKTDRYLSPFQRKLNSGQNVQPVLSSQRREKSQQKVSTAKLSKP